jgi:hypothetical protein
MSSMFQATFDFICHPLRCPRCGGITDDCSIDLQTKIARAKELRCLRVGDHVELDPDPREGGGYLATRDSARDDQLRVIEAWSCPLCGASFLWATAVFDDGTLLSVTPTELTEETLSAVDFITSEALMLIPMERTLEVKRLPPRELRAEMIAAAKILESERDTDGV